MKYTIRLQTFIPPPRPPRNPLIPNPYPFSPPLTSAQRPPILYISTLTTKTLNLKPET